MDGPAPLYPRYGKFQRGGAFWPATAFMAPQSPTKPPRGRVAGATQTFTMSLVKAPHDPPLQLTCTRALLDNLLSWVLLPPRQATERSDVRWRRTPTRFPGNHRNPNPYLRYAR